MTVRERVLLVLIGAGCAVSIHCNLYLYDQLRTIRTEGLTLEAPNGRYSTTVHWSGVKVDYHTEAAAEEEEQEGRPSWRTSIDAIGLWSYGPDARLCVGPTKRFGIELLDYRTGETARARFEATGSQEVD
jgi:hypothetical protein